MLIVDDILLAPFKGLFWVFQEIHNAVKEEQVANAEDITSELRYIYMLVETGKITEAEFNAQEKKLLDRLDKIKNSSDDQEEEEEEE